MGCDYSVASLRISKIQRMKTLAGVGTTRCCDELQ